MDSDDADISLQTGEVIPATGDVQDRDTLNILIATDNHLGYGDNDPDRENDGFVTFEEILQLAHKHNVDMVLLGGDLFHENKPKPSVIRRTFGLLQKYCLGNKPVSFQYVGFPERDFRHEIDPEVNYYNANMNIALPIFTIHGNHDDPIGSDKTSAVDHFATAKLLNHFGQWDDLNKITVSPVLLTKGETKLALYGLGHLKDERLHRLMRDKKVEFVGPQEDTDEWFKLFVLHQNRVKHGKTNYIPENYIPGYMNLIMWGHEHECRIKQERAEGLPHTFITQPGSSVATSLCPGEAVDKHVAILRINRRKFRIEPIKLETVRPLVMTDVATKDVFASMKKNATPKEKSRHLEIYIENVVKSLIRDAEDKLTGNLNQPTKPLVRVRVFHDDIDDTFNAIRFGQKFAETVANEDIVTFKKTPVKREGNLGEIDVEEIEQLMEDFDDDDLDSHVETIVESYFAKLRAEGGPARALEVLSEKGLTEAIKCAVEKDDDKIIDIVVDHQIDTVVEFLKSKKVNEDNVEDLLEDFRETRYAAADQEINELEALISSNVKPGSKERQTNGNARGARGSNNVESDDDDVYIDDDDDDDYASSTSSRSTRGAARGGRGSRARGNKTESRGGRGGRTASSRDDSVSPQTTSQSSSRGRGRGRGRGAAAAKDKSAGGKNLVQTTLNMRRSPRKGRTPMVFEEDSD